MSWKTKDKYKLKLSKFISLVLIMSIITFIGSLIGFNLITDMKLSNSDQIAIGSFIGLFSIIMFFLISFWIFAGTMTAFFNIFKSKKGTITWKIFGSITLMFIFIFATIVVAVYITFLIDFIKYLTKIKLNNKWFENVFYYLKENMSGSKNKYYIVIFTFAMAWAISLITYKIAYRVLGQHIKIKKQEEVTNKETQEKVINSKNNNDVVKNENDSQNNANNLELANENKIDEKSTLNENEKNSNPTQSNNEIIDNKSSSQSDEDDWLMGVESDQNDDINKMFDTSSNNENDDVYDIFD